MTPSPQELEMRQRIAAALEPLEPDVRARVLAKAMDHYDPDKLIGALGQEIGDHEKAYKDVLTQLTTQEASVTDLQARAAALKALRPWYELPEYRLERNDCSRLHKLAEAFARHRVIRSDETATPPNPANHMLVKGAHVFVVQNDWAAAFANATDYDGGDFNLPFEHCAFEFRISGRTVIVIAFQPGDETRAKFPAGTKYAGQKHIAQFFVQSGDYWWNREELAREETAAQYAWKQIRAISIALDAEVATHDVIRASVPLNEKRVKKGEPPLHDFHVVKLRGRQAHSGAGMGGTHRSPRLHFRRGHWRHYETHRTWIKWMLVGDPDLGFIDKSYRL